MFSNGLTTGVLATLLAGSQLAAAHMQVSYPPPLRSKFNPNADNIDYSYTAPLDPSGANYPCKGYLSDLGTPSAASTANFAPGGAYNFTVAGSATHGGGSCQVSLSYDKGKTFTVIQSIIGGCPLSSSYPFTIPSDAPEGEAIWAWTWNNEIGNRELYMNCAVVTIGGGGAKREVKERASAAFSSRPQVFLANIGNGCTAPEGVDVDYPNPGPDVVTSGSKIGPPVGSCGSGSGSGAGSGSGSGSGNEGGDAPSSAVQDTAAPAPTPAPAPSSSKAALPGGVFITVPEQGASSQAPAPTPTPSPTTLVVSTRPAASAPAATGGASTGSGSGVGANAAGSPCSTEGSWNCIGGTSFQRCASGTWSVVQPVAAGTVCKVGESATLSIEAASSKLRFRGSAKMRLSA